MDLSSNKPLDVWAFIDKLYSKMAEFEHGLDQIQEDKEKVERYKRESGCGSLHHIPLYGSMGESSVPSCLPRISPSSPDPKSIKVKLLKGQPRYTSILEQIRALLLQKDTPTANEVQRLLGHGVLAGTYCVCTYMCHIHVHT